MDNGQMRQGPTKFLILAAIFFCLAPTWAQAEMERFAKADDKFQLRRVVIDPRMAGVIPKIPLNSAVSDWRHAHRFNLQPPVSTSIVFRKYALEISHDVMRQYRETLIRRSIHPDLLKLFDDALAWAQSLEQKSVSEVHQFAMGAKAKADKIRDEKQKKYWRDVSEKLIENLKKLRHKPAVFDQLKKEIKNNNYPNTQRAAWEEIAFLADAGDYPPAQLFMSDYFSQRKQNKLTIAYYWLQRAKYHGVDVTSKIKKLGKNFKDGAKQDAKDFIKLYRVPAWDKSKPRENIPTAKIENQQKANPPTLEHHFQQFDRVKVNEPPEDGLKLPLGYFTGKHPKYPHISKNKLAAELRLKHTAIISPLPLLREKRAYMIKKRWPTEFIALFDSVLAWRTKFSKLDLDEIYSVTKDLIKKMRALDSKENDLYEAYDLVYGVSLRILRKLNHPPTIFDDYIEDFWSPGPLHRTNGHIAIRKLAKEDDYIPAQLAIAERYSHGQASIRNLAKALYWYTSAQNFGADVTQPLRELSAHASPQDYKKAAEWRVKKIIPGD